MRRVRSVAPAPCRSLRCRDGPPSVHNCRMTTIRELSPRACSRLPGALRSPSSARRRCSRESPTPGRSRTDSPPTAAATTPTALKLFLPLANEGIPDAQYSLGVMYNNGRGVPRSYPEAAKWFRRAAEQGQAGAQYDLGVLYAKGQGVPEDSAEAAKWFRRAGRAWAGQRPVQPRLPLHRRPGRAAGLRRGGPLVSQGGRAGRHGFAEPSGHDVQHRRRRDSRILPRRRGGIARRPIRATRTRRTSWDRCTATARASRRTTSRRTGGSTSPHRATTPPTSRRTTVPSRTARPWPPR